MVPPIVDRSWLAEHDGDAVMADVRWYLDGRAGQAEYDSGHLPGAVFVDLDRALSAGPTEGAGRHPLPTPEQFAAGMSEVGIGDGDLVVAYDDVGEVIAARLVWMLRVTGHDSALLDGGIAAWTGPLEVAPSTRSAARFRPRPWPADRLASIDGVADRSSVVLDARTRERYEGGTDPVDPRSGHVPGARSLPCRENLDAGGHFSPVEELRRRFESVGAGEGAEVVSYCGSGVTACHNLLAREYAGLGAGRLFVGSWSQWSRDTTRPVATGPAPG